MEVAAKLRRGISRQFSMGSSAIRRDGGGGLLGFRRQASARFAFGRQSSLDPNRRSPVREAAELAVPENLDATMQLLFMACRGDAKGVEDLLKDGVDVNSIDLDGRTALHIAACEGHADVAAADAKYYGHVEVYNLLRSRGAKAPKTRKTPMTVSNPRDGMYQVAKWNGTKVSVKILDKEAYSDPDSINAFKNELTLLEKVRHPNVVQFVGAVTQNIPMMIVSEYLQNGDLGSYLQRKGRIDTYKALKFALDIARGMNYLHECKPDPIIHCNLKPKNIFRDDGGGRLKVAGFGLISIQKMSTDKFKLAHPITPDDSVYVAPEIYKNEIFDRGVDSFSFGLILYEMIEGTPPFHPKSPEDAAKMICLEGLRPQLKNKSKSYFPELKELIEECWNPQPEVRPTFAEIIIRLKKIHANSSKQSRWRDNFKLPWK
ncbi:Serine/threonine-protein kinase STY17 [Ananas comosus]|uniref:non-specific serine/threonine protein kinase n=1 Tax=Ananas comosus TaxID=4615 RepID=A0A199V3X1_ANACO|nr:Serine/threonine-protein kinase STY17 [Ananas comosus]